MTVLTLTGKPINWARPPKANAIVLWHHQGRNYKATFRNACHMESLNAASVRTFKTALRINQPCNNKGVDASAGTHDYWEVWDLTIPGVSWTDQNRFFRQRGFAGWVRTPAQGFTYHYHGFTLPVREGVDVNDDFKMSGVQVGKYVDGGWSTAGRRFTSSQIADYYAHAFGLSNHHRPGSDKSWYPADISATIFNLGAYVARQARGGSPIPPPAPPKPPKVALRVDGVDISHHQSGKLDFKAAKKAGVKWVYHKATEGATYRDPNYAKRRAEVKAAGLPFGAYHFASPDGTDAATEAKFFLAVAQPKPGDLLPMLDFEETGGLSQVQIGQWIATFSAVVERAIGVKPILYTQSSWNLGAANEKNHLIWRARYNNDNRPPTRRADIHQFSNGVLGTPNSVKGLGHVDLNSMRAGLTVAQMRIPAPPPKPQPKPDPTAFFDLKIGHLSLQFSDSARAKMADIDKAFSRGYHVITGTEAWEPVTREILKRVAARYGYRIYIEPGQDCWVAAQRSLVAGNWTPYWEQVIKGQRPEPGKNAHSRRGVHAVTFDTGVTGLGRLTVISGHYLTKGKPGDPNPVYRENVAENKAMAVAIGNYAVKMGKGSALVVYGGDQNIGDKGADTFFDQPLTSCWDELKKWPNTGYGTYDVIASYDRDGRVRCIHARAFTDEQLHLETDHYLIEATYRITLRRAA